jgi:hypothetical protein
VQSVNVGRVHAFGVGQVQQVRVHGGLGILQRLDYLRLPGSEPCPHVCGHSPRLRLDVQAVALDSHPDTGRSGLSE